MNRVADKVALITGGGSGIGAATARIVCAEGGRVMLVDANQAGLVDTQRDIRDNVPGAQVATFLADVSEADLAIQAVEKTLQTFARLDILVNNASMRNYSAVSAAAPAEWSAMVGVNLIGPAKLLPGRAAHPAQNRTLQHCQCVVSLCRHRPQGHGPL